MTTSIQSLSTDQIQALSPGQIPLILSADGTTVLGTGMTGNWVGVSPTDARLVAFNAAQQNTMSAASQYNAAIAAGVVVTSSGTPLLNGTYPITPGAVSDIQAQQVSINTQAKFTNGQTTRVWLDINGVPHTFPSTAEFTAFAEAVGAYVDALILAQASAAAGQTVTWPSNVIAIP